MNDKSESDIQQVLAEAIRNSVWASAPVHQQPEVRLASWQVYAVGSSRHFVGHNLTLREGRVSTAIKTFDPQTRRGTTASGRVYELVGPPGRDPDGDWVFGMWLQANRIPLDQVACVPPEEVLQTAMREQAG